MSENLLQTTTQNILIKQSIELISESLLIYLLKDKTVQKYENNL